MPDISGTHTTPLIEQPECEVLVVVASEMATLAPVPEWFDAD